MHIAMGHRGNWDCTCNSRTEGTGIVLVTTGQRKIGLCSQLISYGTLENEIMYIANKLWDRGKWDKGMCMYVVL